jgi:hypothetical protein
MSLMSILDGPPSPPSKAELDKAFAVVAAVSESIRQAGKIPSGHLYAMLMGHMSLEYYESILRMLESAKLITVDSSHLIRWIGPQLQEVSK